MWHQLMINYWIMIIISYSSASVWIKLSSKYVTLSFFCINVGTPQSRSLFFLKPDADRNSTLCLFVFISDISK